MIWGRRKTESPPSPSESPDEGEPVPPPEEPKAAAVPPREQPKDVAPPSPEPTSPAEPRTTIGEEMKIEGSVSTGSPLSVSGEIRGTVTTARDVDVHAGGVITGSVAGINVTVEGTVEGPVSATGRLLIKSSGRVRGDVVVKTILMEEGGVLLGRCSMQK